MSWLYVAVYVPIKAANMDWFNNYNDHEFIDTVLKSKALEMFGGFYLPGCSFQNSSRLQIETNNHLELESMLPHIFQVVKFPKELFLQKKYITNKGELAKFITRRKGEKSIVDVFPELLIYRVTHSVCDLTHFIA